MNSYTIRERTTDNLDFELLADGTAISLVDVDHVEMHMIDSAKKTYRYSTDDASPKISIESAAEGQVRFSPPSGTFLYRRSIYKLYWIVYTTATEKYSVPENDRFEITVLKEF